MIAYFTFVNYTGFKEREFGGGAAGFGGDGKGGLGSGSVGEGGGGGLGS